MFAFVGAYSWAADVRAKRTLRVRSFEDRVNVSLECRYSDSRSFKTLYNGAHEVANQPIFMVVAMLGITILALEVGTLYVHSPDITLPFVILVFVLGLVLYFGDIIEAALLLSFAENSALSRSDRKSVEYFGRVVSLGRFFLTGVALCLLSASVLGASGLLPQEAASFALVAIAFVPCLILSLAWRGTQKRLQPSIV